VLRVFELCFVQASCTTGWSIHLSSNLVEATFELERANMDYSNTIQINSFDGRINPDQVFLQLTIDRIFWFVMTMETQIRFLNKRAV